MKFPKKNKISGPEPVSTPHKGRFVSDDFNYDLTLNKQAPYWHETLGNLGVVLGSGPMMFFVGTMGQATDYTAPMVAASGNMSPDGAPTSPVG